MRDALNAGDTDQARGLLEGVASGALGAVPSSTIVDAGGTITIGAQVSSVPFDYELRWERDGFALADGGRFAGTASPTLVISDATRFDSGEYRLRVKVPGASAASAPVYAGVRASPFGVADFQGDGDIDVVDILAFLQALAAAMP